MSKKHLAYFAFFFYIITFSAPVFAKDSEKKKQDYLNMKITPEIGIMNGVIHEYVFSYRCKNIDNKLSELTWELKNLPYIKLTADFDVLKYAYIGLAGKIGFPAESGIMQDYDWLNSTSALWSHESPYELTNYSRHVNKLQKYLMFTVNLGGNIFLPLDIKLTPFISYQYEIIAFDGRDGWRTYKSENYKVIPFEGKVISYTQETNSVLFGLKFSVNSIPRTSLYGDFFCSPMLSFTNALDYHYVKSNTGTAYWDKLDFMWNIQADFGIQYRFNKRHSSGISGGIQYIPVGKGVTSIKNLGTNGKPAYGKWSKVSTEYGGSKRLIWTLSLNYSFSL